VLADGLRILIAVCVGWLNFVTIDVFFGLPKEGGVCGATAIVQEIEKKGGALHGNASHYCGSG
jgi:energy-converting hydrogenase A subunit B